MENTRKLDDWIKSYLEFTSNDEPRESFRLFTAISTVAACLQRKCWGNWETEIYPNLYIVLVGPPASRKNTAISPAEKMLLELGIPVSAQATTPQALIRKMQKLTEMPQETTELMLAASDAAMTIISKEFTVFLGVRNLDLISILCEWYDCDANWTYETKNMGIDAIQNVWVNLLAGTTPTALKDALPRESIGMGLTSRIIFVYEDDKAHMVFFPSGVDVYDPATKTVRKLNTKQHFQDSLLRESLIADLTQVSMMQGVFTPTMEYHQLYAEWRKEYEEEKPFKGTLLENYANRAQTHARKLSMIFCASRSNDMILEVVDFQRAIAALNKIEPKMNMAFSGIGKSDIAETADRIMKFILAEKTVTLQRLTQKFWNDADQFTLDKIIKTLAQMGFCTLHFKDTTTIIKHTGMSLNQNRK